MQSPLLMLKTRRLLLCTSAMLVANSIAASSASALKERYFIRSTELSATETVGGTVATATITAEWAGETKILITCTENTRENATIEGLGLSKEKIKLKKCELAEKTKTSETKLGSKCEVGEPIILEIEGSLTRFEGGGNDTYFIAPKAGEPFAEIMIKEKAATCVYGEGAGKKYKLAGSERASFGANGNKEAEAHEIKFPISTLCPGMTFEGKPAELTMTVSSIKLTGANANENWSMQ